MTAQAIDTIVINGEDYSINELPLEPYWKQEKNRPSFFSGWTSMNRGYFAKWLIENKQLFLIDFNGENALVKITYRLIDIFPESGEKVFAYWFTGELTIPMGKRVDYFHGGSGPSFEYSTRLYIRDGLVIDSGVFTM